MGPLPLYTFEQFADTVAPSALDQPQEAWPVKQKSMLVADWFWGEDSKTKNDGILLLLPLLLLQLQNTFWENNLLRSDETIRVRHDLLPATRKSTNQGTAFPPSA